MSATIFGLNGTSWDGSKGLFFWVLESMASRTENVGLRRMLLERSEGNVHWLDLDEGTPQEHDELLRLIHETPAVGRRTLPESEYRDHAISQLDELLELQ